MTTTHTDPIAQAVLESEHIRLCPRLVHMQVDGDWLRVTPHAIDRFGERTDEHTRGLMPHLDLTMWAHRVAAIYALLTDGERGSIQNRHRGQVYGYRSGGWFFVLDVPSSPDVVVTCYPTRGAFCAAGEGAHQ